MQELAGMKIYSLKDVCKLLKIGPKKGLELFNNMNFLLKELEEVGGLKQILLKNL